MKLRDAGTISSTMVVSDVGKIADLNVGLNITHSAVNELVVYLISPEGLRIQLVSGLKPGANLTNSTLDDSAALLITAGTAPYTGTFRPTGDLTNYEGANLKGTWTLEITDISRKNTGTLNNWSLIVEPGS